MNDEASNIVRGRKGTYSIGVELGQGAMGTVYRGEMVASEGAGTSGKSVAIKFLRTDESHQLSHREATSRFRNELQMLRNLVGVPGVVRYIDHAPRGSENMFYVMEYVAARPLDKVIAESPLTKNQAIRATSTILGAVQRIHDLGYVHRDLKPHNICLDLSSFEACIIDFGSTKSTRGGVGARSMTQQFGARIHGSPAYMAPEMILRPTEIDSRCDLYSVGMMLYAMMDGEPAFRGTKQEVMAQQGKEKPRDLGDCVDGAPMSPRLQQIVDIALEKTPERRYQTAGEFREALEDVHRVLGKIDEMFRSGLDSRYKIIDEIASGGSATVYRAKHESDNVVALKILSNSDPASVESFAIEIDRHISDENIVQLKDFGVHGGVGSKPRPALVMEYVGGGAIADAIPSSGGVAPDFFFDTVRDVAKALQRVHADKTAHRDVKPDNMLRTEDGKTKISDFGIAKKATTGITAGKTVGLAGKGTVEYLSPEQCELREDVDHRADIYALGVTMYELLASGRPFNGTPSEIRMGHLSQDPPPLKPADGFAHPVEVCRLIEKCLKKDRTERVSASEIIDELERIRSLPGRKVMKKPFVFDTLQKVEETREPTARAPVSVATLVAVFVVAIGIGGFGAWKFLAEEKSPDSTEPREDRAELDEEEHTARVAQLRTSLEQEDYDGAEKSLREVRLSREERDALCEIVKTNTRAAMDSALRTKDAESVAVRLGLVDEAVKRHVGALSWFDLGRDARKLSDSIERILGCLEVADVEGDDPWAEQPVADLELHARDFFVATAPRGVNPIDSAGLAQSVRLEIARGHLVQLLAYLDNTDEPLDAKTGELWRRCRKELGRAETRSARLSLRDHVARRIADVADDDTKKIDDAAVLVTDVMVRISGIEPSTITSDEVSAWDGNDQRLDTARNAVIGGLRRETESLRKLIDRSFVGDNSGQWNETFGPVERAFGFVAQQCVGRIKVVLNELAGSDEEGAKFDSVEQAVGRLDERWQGMFESSLGDYRNAVTGYRKNERSKRLADCVAKSASGILDFVAGEKLTKDELKNLGLRLHKERRFLTLALLNESSYGPLIGADVLEKAVGTLDATFKPSSGVDANSKWRDDGGRADCQLKLPDEKDMDGIRLSVDNVEFRTASGLLKVSVGLGRRGADLVEEKPALFLRKEFMATLSRSEGKLIARLPLRFKLASKKGFDFIEPTVMISVAERSPRLRFKVVVTDEGGFQNDNPPSVTWGGVTVNANSPQLGSFGKRWEGSYSVAPPRSGETKEFVAKAFDARGNSRTSRRFVEGPKSTGSAARNDASSGRNDTGKTDSPSAPPAASGPPGGRQTRTINLGESKLPFTWVQPDKKPGQYLCHYEMSREIAMLIDENVVRKCQRRSKFDTNKSAKPIAELTYGEAQRLISALNQKGLAGVPNGWEFALPSLVVMASATRSFSISTVKLLDKMRKRNKFDRTHNVTSQRGRSGPFYFLCSNISEYMSNGKLFDGLMEGKKSFCLPGGLRLAIRSRR